MLAGFGICAGCQKHKDYVKSRNAKEVIRKQEQQRKHWEYLMEQKYGKDWKGKKV